MIITILCYKKQTPSTGIEPQSNSKFPVASLHNCAADAYHDETSKKR